MFIALPVVLLPFLYSHSPFIFKSGYWHTVKEHMHDETQCNNSCCCKHEKLSLSCWSGAVTFIIFWKKRFGTPYFRKLVGRILKPQTLWWVIEWRCYLVKSCFLHLLLLLTAVSLRWCFSISEFVVKQNMFTLRLEATGEVNHTELH